ncbi:copper resistance CopC/CopD family protein [Peribacillus asahii]|uniref:copper resistance CopC/CopD family protein n=1 Tax=Peribacillus asahii TaxID=228899 RepID=UPI00207B03F7|nr:copper resistance protein CopC [Peribacillus asahii]USK60114.1 copper resistance protein CopC [Peribacillus asahii]
MNKQGFALLILLLLSVSFPSFTLAHSHVIQSTPGEGEVLNTLPSTVSVTFNAPIQAAFYSLEVYNESEERVDADENVLEDNVLKNKLPNEVENGSYTLKWKVVSKDGHPTEGSLSFVVDVKPAEKPIEKEEIKQEETTVEEKIQPEKTTPEIGHTLTQSLLYGSLSLYIGVLFFHLKLLPNTVSFHINNQSKLLLWISYAGLMLSILLSLPLQARSISGSISDTLTLTTFGTVWFVEVLLLFFLLLSTWLLRKASRKWAAALVILLLLSLMLAKSFIGHTMMASIPAAAITMNFLHLAAMSLWLGGLLAICLVLPRAAKHVTNPDERKTVYWQVLHNFSSWALIFVSVLLTSGVCSSLLHIDSMDSLLTTLYGQVLLVKVALTLVMILFGAYHFFRVKGKKKTLGPSVLIEFCFGIIVLVLAAILTNLPTAI